MNFQNRELAVALRLALGALLLAGYGGCASAPPATDKLERARMAIARAEQAGAVESDPVDIATARDKLARAEVATQHRHDALAAARLAEQAEADADVAEANARAAKANIAVAELDKSIAALRQEAQSKSSLPSRE